LPLRQPVPAIPCCNPRSEPDRHRCAASVARVSPPLLKFWTIDLQSGRYHCSRTKQVFPISLLSFKQKPGLICDSRLSAGIRSCHYLRSFLPIDRPGPALCGLTHYQKRDLRSAAGSPTTFLFNRGVVFYSRWDKELQFLTPQHTHSTDTSSLYQFVDAMDMSKKLGRFKQWAGEKMGGEAKTDTSEEFKMLQAEMDLRHEGMDKMHKSMTTYVKWIGKRTEDKEKMSPVGHVGATYIAHGQDYAPESDYGNCLISMGRAQETIARKQETYLATATSTWLEGLERSLAQMKDYQAARKKLEQRRIAYDASLVKVQKAKREDYRVEEELRAQKAKYEEASEDTYRRMMDIKEAEVDSIADISAFLDAELAYYDSCRDVLMNLKREWPGEGISGQRQRPRSNTAQSYTNRSAYDDDSPTREKAPALPMRGPRAGDSPNRNSTIRPSYSRTQTSDSVRSDDQGQAQGIYKLVRIPTEPTALVQAHRGNLRQVSTNFENKHDEYDRSDSPMSRVSTTPSRSTSWSAVDTNGSAGPKKTIPPPPVNRAKKPPPPPPPMKRSALSTSQIPHY